MEAWGYRYVEVPSLIPSALVRSATEGTENRVFEIENMVLLPEVTKYIASQGSVALGASKVYYVARCFRNETTTDATRLREFTQIGVELLGSNPLDCKTIVRKDAIRLFRELMGETGWKLQDGVVRGLNLYVGDATFEIESPVAKRQLLGGDAYQEGAGWALGLERLQSVLS